MSKKKKYCLVAEVERTVIDTVLIRVEAETQSEAYATAHRALEVFPKPHGEDGVDFCYVENRENLGSKVVNLQESKEQFLA